MYIGACCPPVVSTGDAVLDAAEEVDELCVSSGESDVVPDDGVDVMDLPNYWDVKRDWADACLDAEVESDNLPRVVQQTATVCLLHDPRPNGKALARQSVIRPGSGKESFSIYCYSHTCKVVKKPDQYPPLESIRQWVKAGMDLPFGEAGRLQHLAMWPSV